MNSLFDNRTVTKDASDTNDAFENYARSRRVGKRIPCRQDLTRDDRISFTRAELESCANGALFGIGNAQLPSPPLLMLNRVVDLQIAGGAYDKGFAIAEIDIHPSNWYFKHHFEGDPLMPGCLLTEAMWQLTGFYLGWRGLEGKGRILDSGNTRFIMPVSAKPRTLTVSVQIRKIITTSSSICFADANIHSETSEICHCNSIKLGLF